MELSFSECVLKNHAIIHNYRVPDYIKGLILANSSLEKDKEYSFNFMKVIDFNNDYYGYSITYIFSQFGNESSIVICDMKTLRIYWPERVKENEGTNDKENEDETQYMSYYFTKSVYLDKQQLLFLCAIFHHLNCEEYKLAVANWLYSNYGVDYDNIKEYYSEGQFHMNIFVK